MQLSFKLELTTKPFVNKCNNITKKIKVFKKNADIYNTKGQKKKG